MNPPTEIVVVLYHREDETREMFEQLSKVTDNYSLIIVDNGFDDPDLIRGLEPLHYIENKENTGAIRGINQGLEQARGEYVAVLHSDVLIYDEGWLDHIIEFMGARPDVGLVGFQGAHTIRRDGRLDLETNVVPHRGRVPASLRPTWRCTEVAMIDGVGWGMRQTGPRLEESYGLMHCYDLDLSLQYIQSGFRVFACATDFHHLIQMPGGDVELVKSSRGRVDYLDKIGGDDELYFESVTAKFAEKWGHVLPITRGFMDERYFDLRPPELRDQVARHECDLGWLNQKTEELAVDNELKQLEIAKAIAYADKLNGLRDEHSAEVERLSESISRLAMELETGSNS